MRQRTRLSCFALLALATSLGCTNENETEAPPGTPAEEPKAAASGTDEPAPAADEWIVFSSARSGNGDVYAVHPGTGELRQLTESPLAEGSVRHDRARDRIVYQRHGQESSGTLLFAGDEELFEDPNSEVPPDWSPDGQWIVYSSVREGREDLYMARADGSEERRLTEDEAIDRYPVWSPDSQRIAFARRPETGWDLYLLDPFAESPSSEPLTDEGVYVGHPDWSPDGRSLAFDTWLDGQAEIAVLDLSSGEITRLTQRAGMDLAPAWSSDGKTLAFGSDLDNAGNWDLWTIELETLRLQRLTRHEGFDGGPIFVPTSALP